MRVVPPSGGARTEAAASCTSPRLLHVSTIFVTHFPCPRRCTVCTVFARCTAHGHAASNPCTPTLHCHGWPCHHTVHYRTPSLVGSPSNSITPHVPYDVSPNGFPIRLHLYPSSNPSQLYQLDLRIMDRSSALPMASHHEFKSVWNFLLLYNCLRKTPQVARSPIANTNPPNNYFNTTHPRVNINGTRDGMCDTKEGAPRVVVHLPHVPGGLRGAVRQQFLPSSTAKGAAVAGGHLHYLTGSRKHGGEVPRRCCRIGETSWVVVSNYENESRMQLGHRH